MNREFDQDEYGSYYTAVGITLAVSLAITRVVTLGIAIFVTLVVLVLAAWLAYLYLPPTLFRVLAFIVLADIALGIVVRAIHVRRKRA